MESEEEINEGLDTSYIVLIFVFSAAFAIPIIVWCVREVRNIDWKKLFEREQGQRLLEAKQRTKEAIDKRQNKKKNDSKDKRKPKRSTKVRVKEAI